MVSTEWRSDRAPARRPAVVVRLVTLQRVHRLHRLGWSLFIVSAVLFTWAGVRTRDWLVVAASVVFGVACVLFLVATEEGGDEDR